MEKLLQIITQTEATKLPCRYTITPLAGATWLSVQMSCPTGDKILDYTLPPLPNGDAIPQIKQLLPQATICTIDDRIFIDNLK